MEKEYTAKYLRITIHDNDFWQSLEQLSRILYETFLTEKRFPEEDEFPLLKKYIQSLWFSLHNLKSIMRWNKNVVGFRESAEDIFVPILEFVDYLDIPDWDDNESVYIPMFENAEIIRR